MIYLPPKWLMGKYKDLVNVNDGFIKYIFIVLILK